MLFRPGEIFRQPLKIGFVASKGINLKFMRYKENEFVELKKSTSELKEAVISISAMLNKHGKGVVYFGIKDDGMVLGQQASKETLRNISQAIAEHIEPKVFPRIKTIAIKARACVVVEFEGTHSPYFAYGRAYMRVADTDRQLSARELERMFVDKNRNALRWDSELCAQADLGSISARKVKVFTVEAGLKYDSLRNVLAKLKLMAGLKPRNTAVLLFGKKPEDIFVNAHLRCAVFGGIDTAYIADMKDYHGDVFFLIEKAQEYILEKIDIGMRIEGLRRIDVPEIDREAVREAIINAFCHRDYREPDSVNIAVFKDRLEIRSPGLLYGGLTIQQIRSKIVSERRNELIADMFHRVHFVERWGRGIKLILSKEPTAVFTEIGTQFVAVFKRKPQERNIKSDKPGKREGEGLNEGLNEGLKSLLAAIKSKPGIQAKDLSKVLKGRPVKTIERQIKTLVDNKLVERKGSRKAGGYYLRADPIKEKF